MPLALAVQGAAMFAALAAAARGAVSPALVRTLRARPRVAVKLAQDVPGLGNAGEVVKVKAGFARNVLTYGPKKVAEYVPRTSRARTAVAAASSSSSLSSASMPTGAAGDSGVDLVAAAAQRKREMVAAKLPTLEVLIKRQEGNKWEVTAENIVEKLKKQHRIELPASAIVLPQPIRERYGAVMLAVRFEGGLESKLLVNVVKR